jgi:hypothetical protein
LDIIIYFFIFCEILRDGRVLLILNPTKNVKKTNYEKVSPIDPANDFDVAIHNRNGKRIAQNKISAGRQFARFRNLNLGQIYCRMLNITYQWRQIYFEFVCHKSNAIEKENERKRRKKKNSVEHLYSKEEKYERYK